MGQQHVGILRLWVLSVLHLLPFFSHFVPCISVEAIPGVPSSSPFQHDQASDIQCTFPWFSIFSCSVPVCFSQTAQSFCPLLCQIPELDSHLQVPQTSHPLLVFGQSRFWLAVCLSRLGMHRQPQVSIAS